MNVKILHWKRVAGAVLLILLLNAVGLTKSLAQEWQTLTLNDGTDLNEYVPFYGQFSSEYPTYSQFIIPATDLTEMATGGVIRSMTFHNSDYYLSWGGYDYNVYDYRDGQFEVRIKEVPFDKFDNDYYPQNDLYDWENMDLFFEGSLIVSDYQMTIWYNNEYYSDNGYYYGGGNLLVGIKPITVYQTNSCSWYGINESVEEWGISPSASFNNNSGFLYFMPKVTLEYKQVSSLTVNDGTDLKSEFFPQSEGEACQFVIPASELGDLSWNYIKALTLYCDYEENGGGDPIVVDKGEDGTRTAPDWSNYQFEVRIKEVNFQQFEYDYQLDGYQFYDWEAMTLVYQGGLSVIENKISIPFNVEPYNNGYQYEEGSHLLVGIRLVSNNYYWDYWVGTFSLYGINEDWPCTSLYSPYGDGYVYTPNFKPKVSFGYEEGYAPSCLKPQYLQANKQVHYATINWTSDAPTFNLQYKKSSEEWDEGHWDYDENWNWVWFEGTTNVVEGLTGTQYTIDSLDFQTSYDVRVQAVCNEWDVSDWASISFTTIKPVAPTDLTVTNLNTPEANTATLQWNYDLSYEYPTYWDIAYTPLLESQPDDVDFITIDATPGNSQVSYVLTNLVPFTAYKAWVRASFGNGEVSDWWNDWCYNCSFMPTNMVQVVLNEGTSTSSKVPFQMYQSSNSSISKSQFIIPASSLSNLANHEIWSMGFGDTYFTSYYGTNFKIDIYFAEVETEQYSTTEYYDWDNMEMVYHKYGSVYNYNTNEFKLDAPYYYEGGNLLVGINAHYSSNSSYNYEVYWKGIQTESYVALASMNDSVPEQIAFLPTATFSYTPSNCHSPHDLAVVVSDDETSATLSWTCEETNCRLCYWTQTDPTPVYVDVTGNSYELINLPKNNYYWKVQSLCSANIGSPFIEGPSFLNVVVKEPAFSNNTYEIYTTGELKWIEGVTNGTITTGTEGVFPTGNRPFAGLTIKLMNDIDLFGLNWRPIGTFGGNFDGNGHAINNLHINTSSAYHDWGGYYYNNVGLFAYLASGGIIHDVNFGGTCSIYSSNDDYIGGIVGQVVSGGEIYNIGIDGEFSVTGSEYVGGIVGSNSGTVHDISVGGEFSVIGSSSVGGIAGYNSNGEIYNAGIDGVASVTGRTDDYYYEYGQYVGGIVGSNPGGTIQNVYNNATVSGGDYVGGIVGRIWGYSQSFILNVYNNASVNGNNNVGGVVGSFYSGSISQAYSKGEITAKTNAGGIIGWAYYGTLTNTYNRGNITATDEGAGGIVGYHNGHNEYFTINNSYSTGYLYSSGYRAPIVAIGGAIYQNNYFLYNGNYSPQSGHYYGSSRTQEYMQSQAFVDALNGSQTPQPWKADFTPNTNDGYPILQWQNPMHAVTYSQPAHGQLVVKNGNMTVQSGTRVADSTVLTVTVLPNNYYELQSLTANGVEIENNTLLVTESVEIVAVLVPVYYTITYTQPQHGQLLVMNDSIIVESGSSVAGGTRLTVNVIPEPGYTLELLTANGHNINNNTLVVTESVEIIAILIPQQPNSYSINATAYPLLGGVIMGSGDYQEGSTCTLIAIPNEGSVFVNWTQNDSVVSTNATYSFIVSANGNYVAHFTTFLPELHVTNLAHSQFVAGQQATISWTVQNDGTAPTPNGTTWQDRVWLSVENRVAVGENNPIFLGAYDNVSALGVGESYTQTKTFNVPIDISGEYYLFVISDAYDCRIIYWENGEMQLPYSPPPYIGFISNHPNYNKVYELSEFEHGNVPGRSYSDNFFYTLVDIAVPLLPDLQVTSIIPPDNFFSGTIVDVTATITNLGESATTRNSRWTDALYFATEPDFGSAMLLSSETHQGILQADSSYQVTFRGHIPLTVYGDGYFFIETDIYDQVYEHVLNHNNVTMSDTVNIILTPPADLEPSEVVAPSVVSTAEGFTYSYIITNVGAGNPNVSGWKDKVYLCQNADTLDATAVLLKTNNHYLGLQPGASYSVNETIALPTSVTMGNYYLHVFVDANDNVFEYLFEGNNLAHSSMITVICPDLQITPNSIPEQITAGYPLNISYTLTNAGEGIIDNRIVTDKIYISSTGSITDTIKIVNIKRSIYLAAGQSLTVMCNDIAPYNLTGGTYHLIVVTDYKNKIKESNEGNNLFSYYPMAVLHQPLPDLVPVVLTLPAVIQAGETIPVQFDITNIGDLDLLNSHCTFDVYATWDDHEILCPMQSQTMPLGSYVSIGINETMHFSRTILVPPTVTSACTTFELVANKGSHVPELDTTNNVFTTTVSVLDCPLPDLMVTNIETTELQTGTEAQITFIVHNNGTADFEGHFNTAVYVRSAIDTILCPLSLQVSPTTNNYAIPMGEMLTFTQKVLIPPMANASCNRLDVVVDKGNFVLEANDDNNTTSLTATVINYPFDLKTTTLQVPESVWAGETTSLTWTVQNIGTCPSEDVPFYVKKNGTYVLVQGETLPEPWVDKLYVSEDAFLSDDDIELCSVTRSTVLHPNGTYSVERSVTLPYTNLGVQYLLCVSDASRVTYDPDTLNNNKSIPVYVQLGSLPDLRITSLNIDEDLVSDRVYWLRYTVINEGERVTQEESWTDAFYIGETLSTFGAFQLGSKIHHGALNVGETYTDSIEVLISNRLEGNYFLMGYTDKTNQIYEHNNENDNLLATSVTVMTSEPCDLIAIQPEFPASVISGEEMTVSWQLRNIGINPSIGRIRNAVYLSTDAAWSSDDVMLGYANTDINIIPNDQQSCSLSGVLTSVPEGSYYVIVKANILNALNETSYENNICVSLLTMEVGYPTLVIGEQVDRTMANNQYIYYKLQVGPEYEGQTLSCTLTTAEQQVANGLYLTHEAVPTLAQYDYGQYTPYAQEIEVLIPVLEQGDYYLLAKGSTQNGSPQQVNIATSIVNFEILHVDTDHGSNTGSITTKITGAKFDSIMDFRLVQGSNYLPAEKVFFSNSTETFTTFDLAEMPIGTYAMEAELPGGIITIKGDAFTIEEGLPAELAVNIVAPSSVRDGTVFPVRIEYGNIGTTDLNVSGFVVISGNGHPIGFTSDELAERLTELTFSTAEGNSNPDVLRPGYRTSKTIFVKASTSANVRVKVFAIRKQY